MITLVGVNLTEWEGCHLAKGGCCPSSHITFNKMCIVNLYPPTSHPCLVRDEPLRCGGSSTIIPLVGVNLTECEWCHLARGCGCHSLPLPFTAVSYDTFYPHTNHPCLVRDESQRCGGSSTIIPLVGVKLTEWEGCHQTRG